jgi:NAD(P)-dependent dehydrogenase (short-subunit alcohol dehydrogenase family)
MTKTNKDSTTVNLAGRTALVTGAGSGIGRAIATTLGRAGAKVAVADINRVALEETVALIEEEGGVALASVTDVSDEQAVHNMINETISRWGSLEILCNNAGIMDRMSFAPDVTTALWNRVFAVNVNGPFFAIRAALPHMRERKFGVIINTASVAGLRGAAAGIAYAASKHAVVGITRSVAWSHANEGIRCNAICPGGVETNMTSGGLEAFDKAGLARILPVISLCERMTSPQVIADVALFLASDSAAYVNGLIMPVDGGWMAG